jgi:hypothetical protein
MYLGLSSEKKNTGKETTQTFKVAGYDCFVFRIDGCEYLKYGKGIAHKGNCDNPIHY